MKVTSISKTIEFLGNNSSKEPLRGKTPSSFSKQEKLRSGSPSQMNSSTVLVNQKSKENILAEYLKEGKKRSKETSQFIQKNFGVKLLQEKKTFEVGRNSDIMEISSPILENSISKGKKDSKTIKKIDLSSGPTKAPKGGCLASAGPNGSLKTQIKPGFHLLDGFGRVKEPNAKSPSAKFEMKKVGLLKKNQGKQAFSFISNYISSQNGQMKLPLSKKALLKVSSTFCGNSGQMI